MKNRLEELRKQRAIRQEDLAQALGVSRQTVISLETGKYNPSILLAHRIARLFGAAIEEIFLYICHFYFWTTQIIPKFSSPNVFSITRSYITMRL